MIVEGLLLGSLSFAALATLYHKMPQPVKNFCQKHPLMTDVISTVGTYVSLGSISSSVVAAIAAGIVALLFEVYMAVQKAKSNGTHTPQRTVLA